MNNVLSFDNKKQIENDYLETIKSLKFGLYKETIVDENKMIQDKWFIVLKDRKTDVVLELTPYTRFLRYTDVKIDLRRSDTIKAWGQFVCRFLNFVLIDNYSLFRIDEIQKVTIEIGNKYIEEYAKGNVGGKEKSLESIMSEINRLSKFYSNIKDIYKKNANKIYKYKWKYKTDKGNIRYNSHFVLNSTDDNKPLEFDIFRNMPINIFEVFLKLCDIYYPELTFAVALQAYAGLRPGEICNVRQSIDPRGPGVMYQKVGIKIISFDIHLKQRYQMRDDGKDVGGIKKRRVQKVYTPYLDRVQELYERHLDILSDYDFNDGYYPMFVNKNGDAITVSSYREKIERLANIYLRKHLAESDNPYFRRYAEILTQKKLSPHFLRHFFTVLLVLDNLTPHEIATWRGDSNLESSLIYCKDKDELLKNIRELNGDIVENILKGANDA